MNVERPLGILHVGDGNPYAGYPGTWLRRNAIAPRRQYLDQSAVHVTGDLGSLLRFYTLLSARAPYISLEQFSVATDRANPGSLNASLRVASVELAR